MVKCCGHGRQSRFCPDCGKRLVAEDPLEGLLKKCRTLRDQALARAEKFKAEGKEPASREAAETAAQWQAWGDALEKAIFAGMDQVAKEKVA